MASSILRLNPYPPPPPTPLLLHAQVPSFDHGVGDPVPDAIRVEPSHRIVICEGARGGGGGRVETLLPS